MSARHRSRRGDGGETLIEVLLAVAIIGVTAVAVLGGLVTAVSSSTEHRSLAAIDADLRSVAEQAKYDIELQPNGPWYFNGCNPPWTSTSYNGHALPSGTSSTVTLQSVVFYNKSTNQFDPPGVCGANDLAGYQELTFVGSIGSVSQTLSIAIRLPG
jgi:type II secretory pathway pseudopilin PulG